MDKVWCSSTKVIRNSAISWAWSTEKDPQRGFLFEGSAAADSGSGLIDQSQKMTAAAMQIAEK
jgi:hypothetical protein